MLPTDYQNFIALSKYARWLPEQKRRETWNETVKRYFDFMEEHLAENNDYKLKKSLREELETAVRNLEVLPSMRALATAGPALDRCNVAGFNCAYLPIENSRCFDELFYILLCGTGVGYSVERQYINELPEVNEHFEKSKVVINVDDSKAGWARALKELIALLYAGQIPTWDVSKVRPAGSRLKTFGGRASGPGPLVDLFQYTVNLFTHAAGRKLTSIECHDLCCKIASAVVVGGVRRSAMISLSNLSDQRMRDAKSGAWYNTHPDRAFANNSVCYTDNPDMQTFMGEWYSLYMSQSGERGIFNRKAATAQVLKNGRRDPNHEWSTNPCCVSAVTPILTSKGYMPIIDTVGKAVQVWNGESFEEVKPYEAGVGELVRVHLSDGSYLDCTPNHRWCIVGKGFVHTENLALGDKLEKFPMPVITDGTALGIDAYSQGFYSGDGNEGYDFSWLYEPKYMCQGRLIGEIKSSVEGRKLWKHGPMLDKKFVPVNGTVDFKLNWLAGLLDSDGTVTRDENGNGFQIGSIDKEFLLRVKLMLTTLGARAKVVKGAPAGLRAMPDGDGGSKEYMCAEGWRLLIGNFDAYSLMSMGLNLSRLKHNGCAPQRDARQFVRVTNVEYLGVTEMTYCFTEPKTSRGTFNGIVTGNSEIILRPYQFCNLTELVVRPDDTADTLRRKARIAAILGTFQSTLTNFKYLRKIWTRNTEEERLLGVSMTGVCDNKLTYDNSNGQLPILLQTLRSEVVRVNKEFADALDIPQSTATTCNKPSGTVSQLVNAASGIHARYSTYYIRRVRSDNKDPLAKFLVDAGVPSEPCAYKPESTQIFSFPIKGPETGLTRDKLNAIQQLELWLLYQTYWCEHKPSVTISVKEHEWMEVGAWVYKNFDKISGISFLPYDGGSYVQAPYEEISEERFKDLETTFPKAISWEKLSEYEKEDGTTSSQEFACTGGICEIVDLEKK